MNRNGILATKTVPVHCGKSLHILKSKVFQQIEFYVVKGKFEYIHNFYLSVNPKGQSRGYFQKICYLERTIEIFGVYSIHKFIKKR